MKINHRLSVHIDETTRSKFAALGIDLEKYQSSHVGSHAFITVDETHPSWNDIEALITRPFQPWPLVTDLCSTQFTDKELQECSRVVMISRREKMYPQPDDFGYRIASFDVSEFCPVCGIGLRQTAPIRLIGEPKWGSQSFFEVFGLPGELFATPQAYEQVKRYFHIDYWPVLRHRDGATLKTVVQLKVADLCVLNMPAHFRSEQCMVCGRTRYERVLRGPFPDVVEPCRAAISKTSKFFGAAALSWRDYVLSPEAYKVFSSIAPRDFRFQATSPMTLKQPTGLSVTGF